MYIPYVHVLKLWGVTSIPNRYMHIIAKFMLWRITDTTFTHRQPMKSIVMIKMDVHSDLLSTGHWADEGRAWQQDLEVNLLPTSPLL